MTLHRHPWKELFPRTIGLGVLVAALFPMLSARRAYAQCPDIYALSCLDFDMNDDGKYDIVDHQKWFQYWWSSNPCADFNVDGAVDVEDLLDYAIHSRECFVCDELGNCGDDPSVHIFPLEQSARFDTFYTDFGETPLDGIGWRPVNFRWVAPANSSDAIVLITQDVADSNNLYSAIQVRVESSGLLVAEDPKRASFKYQAGVSYLISVFATGPEFVDERGVRSGFGNGMTGTVYMDTDADGIPDEWEAHGIPYVKRDGTVDRLPLPGAQSLHKDLYVEVDAMDELSLNDGAKQKLVDAFALAPLNNPDGETGISLHVDCSTSTPIDHVEYLQDNECWPVHFADIRASHFGTSDDKTSQDRIAILAARAMAFRYCILADKPATGDCGGVAERLGADNFVVYFGTLNTDDPFQDVDTGQAAIFMHELGHCLGLNHGGGDDKNGKPNYPSIMNYLLCYRFKWNHEFWELDFSRADSSTPGSSALRNLDESSLDETVGIGSSSGYYSNYQMPFGVQKIIDGVSQRAIAFVRLDGSATDFGDETHEALHFQDNDTTSTSAVQDLNWGPTPQNPEILLPTESSPGETLNSYNDWAHIRLALRGSLGVAAPILTPIHDELTIQARDWINANFPTPPPLCSCLADFDGSGGVPDAGDIDAFFVAWLAGDPSADADCSGGVPDAGDIDSFFASWLAGGC